MTTVRINGTDYEYPYDPRWGWTDGQDHGGVPWSEEITLGGTFEISLPEAPETTE
jgi:hypothetical protein